MRILTLVALIALVALTALCPVQAAPAAQAGSGMAVGDVVKLIQSGIGEEIIIAKLKKDGKAFDLSTDDLIALKNAGATSAILKTMMSPDSGAPAAAKPAAAAPASDLPDEQGVYVKIRGEWKLIEPQVVNMRTANVLGHAMSYGISKAKMKGDVAGQHSKTAVTTPIELLIKTAEGTSASEYQILQMEVKGDRREFEAMQIGFASAKTGARKGLIDVKFEKIGKALYTGTISSIKTGEYGILPPGAQMSANTASSGKMYGFTVLE
jgi:hypothetical protein